MKCTVSTIVIVLALMCVFCKSNSVQHEPLAPEVQIERYRHNKITR